MSKRKKKKENHENMYKYAKIMVDGVSHRVPDFLKNSAWEKENIRRDIEREIIKKEIEER